MGISGLRSAYNRLISSFLLYLDTGDDNDKIDEMHSKRRRLAAFAKLITCNIIPMSNATEIFKNYVKVSNSLTFPNTRFCWIKFGL